MEIKDVLKQLTLNEKLLLITGAGAFSSYGIPEKGIPSIRMADGPYGVKTKGGNAICMMNTCLMASSWDREISRTVGSMLGKEASRLGVDMLLGPAINIKRNPLAGRNFEYYSEDPYLTGILASEYVKGVQGEGILTCAKHFACNNQETFRWSQDSIVDDDTLRNIYLKAFEILVSRAAPDCIMASYNMINHVYACENKYLLKDILRDEWRYSGVVVSDWCAAVNIVESIKNGMELEMPGNAHNSVKKLEDAIKSGKISLERVDEAVERLLALALKTREKNEETAVDIDKLVEITGESFVLLKNEGVLPFVKEEKILLIGTAKELRIQGGGCAALKTNFISTPYEEIGKYASVCDYIDGYDISTIKDSLSTYDKIIVFLTLPEDCDSEAFDRSTMSFPKAQTEVFTRLKEYNQNIIAVLQNGSAVELDFADDVKGILETYYAGSYGSVALAEVLYGNVVPSGRLAESFPVCYEDVPNQKQFGKSEQVYYSEREFVGYRYYTTYGIKPRYAFGFGLSYASFEWEDITFEKTGDYTVELSLTVKNVSDFDGKECVQVYLEGTECLTPRRSLVAFETVRVRANECKRVKICLDESAFSKYVNGKKRIMEGDYVIALAKDSESVIARQEYFLSSKEEKKICAQTLLGDLLINEKYRKTVLVYMQNIINFWAFGELDTEEKFEESVFLKNSVYNMPIRAFTYFCADAFDEKKMEELLKELRAIGGDNVENS